MKKINLLGIYKVLQYLVYFLGGALLIKNGETDKGLGVIMVGAAAFGKDQQRAKQIKELKNQLPGVNPDSTGTELNESVR